LPSGYFTGWKTRACSSGRSGDTGPSEAHPLQTAHATHTAGSRRQAQAGIAESYRGRERDGMPVCIRRRFGGKWQRDDLGSFRQWLIASADQIRATLSLMNAQGATHLWLLNRGEWDAFWKSSRRESEPKGEGRALGATHVWLLDWVRRVASGDPNQWAESRSIMDGPFRRLDNASIRAHPFTADRGRHVVGQCVPDRLATHRRCSGEGQASPICRGAAGFRVGSVRTGSDSSYQHSAVHNRPGPGGGVSWKDGRCSGLQGGTYAGAGG